MKQAVERIDTTTLLSWLDKKKAIFIMDVRPSPQREEWYIPGSFHADVYEQLKRGDESAFDDMQIPDNMPVVTVCALGRTSELAAAALLKKGIQAYSLEGGMKGWSLAWNIAEEHYENFSVLQIRRTGKGCLSYIIYSDSEAAILDASLPAILYEQLLKQRQLKPKFVLETHIHADHISRSKDLAERLQVPLFLPQPNSVKFLHETLLPGTTLSIGNILLHVIPVPGHTLESICIYIPDKAIFTGDTLFIDGVGRPDLKADENETRIKAAWLYQSLQKIIALPQHVSLFPAHTNKPVPFDEKLVTATIGEVRRQVSILQKEKPDFVDTLLQKTPPTPNNYLIISEKNLAGNYQDIDPLELEAGANRCAIS
jgi:glyoxylase-like metal-dependent hydrolase (beta-lactamase superfamily II)/rhodanese-related sulfurtransferase